MQTDLKSEVAFSDIHKMMKANQFKKTVNRLVDSSTGKLNNVFKADSNHAWYCVGLAKYYQREFRQAIEALRRALRNDPEDFMAMRVIGDCYDELGQPKFAERYYRKALTLSPRGAYKAALQYNLGNSLFDQKRFVEAISLYKMLNNRRDEIGRKAQTNLAVASRKLAT